MLNNFTHKNGKTWIELTRDRLLEDKYPKSSEFSHSWLLDKENFVAAWTKIPISSGQLSVNRNIIESMCKELNHLFDFGVNFVGDKKVLSMARSVIKDYGKFLGAVGITKGRDRYFSGSAGLMYEREVSKDWRK